MRKIFSLLFLLLGLFAEQDLQVYLPTKKNLKPIYVSKLHSDSKGAEDLYSVFLCDFERNGIHSVAPYRKEWEEQAWSREFDYGFWNSEKISACLAAEVSNGRFFVTSFCDGKSNRASIKITGDNEKDRKAIHGLADRVLKELTGVEGIASQRIIFSERVKGGESEWLSTIWISDWDGANAKRLTTSKGYCMSPGFLPFGGYYFVSTEQGQSKIYRHNFSDESPELWISLRGNQVLPAVSRDGTQIAYITDLAGRPDLFIQSINRMGKELGMPRQLFSYPRATQASPTFSPDGSKIAFVSNKDGSAKIYMMEIPDPKAKKTPHPKMLTKKNRENTAPVWSPDGKRLAYSARSDGVRQIWIYEFSTGEEWQLTVGNENKENPSWAPDSLHLVYNTETDDVSELFVIDLNRQEPYQITSGYGQKRFASWEIMR